MNKMPCKSIPVINKTSTERRKDFITTALLSCESQLFDLESDKSQDRCWQMTTIWLHWLKRRDAKWSCSTSPSQLFSAATQIHSSSILVYRLLHQTIHLLHLLQPQSHSPALSENSWWTSTHRWPDITTQLHLQSLWQARVRPVSHFSAWAHSLILMVDMFCTSQHNTTTENIKQHKERRCSSFHFVPFFVISQVIFMVQV